MKSLAHPEWPYTGTPFEWRGFAEMNINQVIRELPPVRQTKVLARAEELIAVYQKQNFGPELK